MSPTSKIYRISKLKIINCFSNCKISTLSKLNIFKWRSKGQYKLRFRSSMHFWNNSRSINKHSLITQSFPRRLKRHLLITKRHNHLREYKLMSIAPSFKNYTDKDMNISCKLLQERWNSTGKECWQPRKKSGQN